MKFAAGTKAHDGGSTSKGEKRKPGGQPGHRGPNGQPAKYKSHKSGASVASGAAPVATHAAAHVGSGAPSPSRGALSPLRPCTAARTRM